MALAPRTLTGYSIIWAARSSSGDAKGEWAPCACYSPSSGYAPRQKSGPLEGPSRRRELLLRSRRRLRRRVAFPPCVTVYIRMLAASSRLAPRASRRFRLPVENATAQFRQKIGLPCLPCE